MRCRRRSSLVTAVRFLDGQEALSIDYSGAKYTRFIPKIAAAQKALFRVVENGKHLNRLRNGPRVVIPPPSETPRVSPCVPSCAIFLRKPRVYPLSPVKANVGRLCERLKNAMKCGLEQRCAGNFLAIFAGTVLGEKPNFTGRFFEWRRPFDFSTR